MKKTLALTAAALVSVLALSACTSGTDTPTAADPLNREGNSFSSESLSDNRDLTRGESEFILAIEEYDQYDYTATEEADIAFAGDMVCSDLDSGSDPMYLAMDLAETMGVTEFEGGFVVGLAANTICPEFSELVDEAANAAINGEYDTYA